MQTQTNIKDLMDCDVTDSSGHKVGTVKQVYLNDVSGEPEWVRVHTGWFGTRESFVPLADARRTGDALQVPYDKDMVKHAPAVDADQHLSREQVADLYRYYGLRAPAGRKAVPDQVGTAREGRTQAQAAQAQAQAQPQAQPQGGMKGAAGTAGAGDPAMHDQSMRDQTMRDQTMRGRASQAQTGSETGVEGGRRVAGESASMTDQPRTRPDQPKSKTEQMRTAHGRVAGERAAARGAPADDGMIELTLSEERLRVGTERHMSERVRLRKRIEIEQIERTVAVYREELRIEREPIGEDEAEAGIGRFRIGEAEEREIILHEERPVVSKEIVPVERIRVRAERVAGEQTVRDEIRKERIDIAHDGAEGLAEGRGEPAGGGAAGGRMGEREMTGHEMTGHEMGAHEMADRDMGGREMGGHESRRDMGREMGRDMRPPSGGGRHERR
ncbi:PRC and DUF2382 domain-containing protein [Spirillospora sp. CA-255316]